MKHIVLTFSVIFFVIVLALCAVLVYVDRTEWTLRPKEYAVDIPITSNSGTLAEIEKQARKEALKQYPNSYLGEIRWLTNSDAGFKRLSDGEIQFIYCENLGNRNGYYDYDRYARCEIHVDLHEKKISRIRIYGNNQLGGLEKFETYPECSDIRNLLHEYITQTEAHEQYKVARCYVNIQYGNAHIANFKIEFSDGTEKDIAGQVQARQNGSYIFIETR